MSLSKRITKVNCNQKRQLKCIRILQIEIYTYIRDSWEYSLEIFRGGTQLHSIQVVHTHIHMQMMQESTIIYQNIHIQDIHYI